MFLQQSVKLGAVERLAAGIASFRGQVAAVSLTITAGSLGAMAGWWSVDAVFVASILAPAMIGLLTLLFFPKFPLRDLD